MDVKEGWTSPRLGVRFEPGDETVVVGGPDGQPFRSLAEERARAEEASARAEEASARAEEASARAEEASARAEEASARAAALAAKLRALGIDPDAVG